MRILVFLLPLLLTGCVSAYEAESLRRENDRLRAELRELKDRSAEPGTIWQTYVVQNRDVLSKIAMQLYGDLSRWEEIYEANRDLIGDDPDRLEVGMELRIPPKDPAKDDD